MAIRMQTDVINMIKKIKLFLQNGRLKVEEFPIDSIESLVDNTLGKSFGNIVCSVENESFDDVTKLYRYGFEKFVEKNDTEGCIWLLELLETNYKCLYLSIGEEEKEFRERPYRKMIIELGDAFAKVQYRLHKERYEHVSNDSVVIPQGKGAVYTCLLGNRKLEQPLDNQVYIDYICFTDREDKIGKQEGVWQFRKIENEERLNAIQLFSRYKILAHKVLPEYDFSVWINPGIEIRGNIEQFCRAYGNGNSLLGFAQSSMECIYDSERYITMGNDDNNIGIRKKLARYMQEGYPKDNGLLDGKVIIRNHKDLKLQKVLEDWWIEAKDYGKLGEDCFNYVAWKNDYVFSICDLFSQYNSYFVNADAELETNENY